MERLPSSQDVLRWSVFGFADQANAASLIAYCL
jgi:hypothetical protein